MTLERTLKVLGFEPSETRIYLNLLRTGSSSVGTLAKRTGTARTTLYGMLDKLTDRGLVTQSIKAGVKVFVAESPEKILMLFSAQQSKTDEALKDFREMLPKLKDQKKSILSNPRFQLYEGRQGLQNVLKDMLLYADLESCALWPIKKMMEVLTPDFFLYHNRERISRNIYTRAIWPRNESIKIKDFQFLGSGDEFRREIRIAPEGVDFSLGYWFYANKVAFLASGREGFGFIIESEELVQTLKAQFEIIWNISEVIPCKPDDVKDFLRSFKST